VVSVLTAAESLEAPTSSNVHHAVCLKATDKQRRATMTSDSEIKTQSIFPSRLLDPKEAAEKEWI
jgi:hypothetical protein